MKAFACILSLYILILTAIPCSDVPQDNAAFRIELSQKTTAAQSPADADLCSPFCLCNCCVSGISYQVYALDLTCYTHSRIQLSKYLSADLSFNNTSIWQPPKFC